MSQLDEVVERVRVEADALYAFVLTRRGQMVTKGGPSELPEVGRTALLGGADLVAGTDRIVTVKLSHGEIVQRAGRLSLDCHVGVAAARAVFVVVVRGGVDARRATSALQLGLRAIEPMIMRAFARAESEDKKPAAPVVTDKPAKRLRESASKLEAPPVRRVGSKTAQGIEKEIEKLGTSAPVTKAQREGLRTTLPWRDPSYAPRASAPAEPAPAPAPASTNKAPKDKGGPRSTKAKKP